MACFGSKSIGEEDWKPHNPHVLIPVNERAHGRDWFSKLRYIQQSDNLNTKTTPCVVSTGRRHFPEKLEQSTQENKFYPEGKDSGKRCIIQGEFFANTETEKEIQLEKVIGSKAKVACPRGGLDVRYPGDKSYAVPEYSSQFHQQGSTRPAVDFGGPHENQADTFIPLQKVAAKASIPYKEKDKERKEIEEKEEVLKLDTWEPAPPLTAAL